MLLPELPPIVLGVDDDPGDEATLADGLAKLVGGVVVAFAVGMFVCLLLVRWCTVGAPARWRCCWWRCWWWWFSIYYKYFKN